MKYFSVLISAAILACGPGAPAADVAAELDSQAIPYAEFEAYLAGNAITDAPSLDSQVLSGLFDQFLEELLLTRYAKEEGVDTPGRHSAVAALVERETGTISQDEIIDFFRSNPDRFRRPERVRLRQVLVEERATAELAARELGARVSFESVARQYSQGPQAQSGGEQGVLSRDDLPPELASRIFELDAGEISGIVEADYGFHIFQVVERFEPAETPLELARPEIVEELGDLRRAETLALLLERAVKRYNMRVHTGNLPFQYQGKYG